MSDEQERLARTVNDVVQAGSSCAGCYLGVILLAAVPVVAVAAWAIVGSATGSEELGMVAAGAVAVWLLIVAARLTVWGR